MKRRDFLRKLVSPCRRIAAGETAENTPNEQTGSHLRTPGQFSPEPREDETGKEEQELFLKAMAMGIDPATVDPERLRELVHENP